MSVLELAARHHHHAAGLGVGGGLALLVLIIAGLVAYAKGTGGNKPGGG